MSIRDLRRPQPHIDPLNLQEQEEEEDGKNNRNVVVVVVCGGDVNNLFLEEQYW